MQSESEGLLLSKPIKIVFSTGFLKLYCSLITVLILSRECFLENKGWNKAISLPARHNLASSFATYFHEQYTLVTNKVTLSDTKITLSNWADRISRSGACPKSEPSISKRPFSNAIAKFSALPL